MPVGSERNYLSADKLVSDLDGRKYLVYVAGLALLETISSIRRGIAERRPTEAAESHSSDAAKTMTKCMIKDKIVDFVAATKAFENEEKIINKNPDAPTDKLRHDSLRHLTEYFGEVTVQGNHRRYAGLNHRDFQHALIAKALGAGAFHAFDKGFVALEKMPQFASQIHHTFRRTCRMTFPGAGMGARKTWAVPGGGRRTVGQTPRRHTTSVRTPPRRRWQVAESFPKRRGVSPVGSARQSCALSLFGHAWPV